MTMANACSNDAAFAGVRTNRSRLTVGTSRDSEVVERCAVVALDRAFPL
jgi:hypothetical protein